MIHTRNTSHEKNGGSSTKLAALFCGIVFLLFCVVGAVKVFSLWQHGSFSGSQDFTLALVPEHFKKGQTLQIFAFSPAENTLDIIQVQNAPPLALLGQSLKIPIDASIENVHLVSLDHVAASKYLQMSIVHQYPRSQDLNIVDMVRLWLLANSIPAHNIQRTDITVLPAPSQADMLSLDKVLSPLLQDQQITQENLSVQIINASDTEGAGNRLARLLGNIGVNVISVKSANITQKNSTVSFFSKPSYTSDRISHITGFSPLLQKRSNTLFDIIVTIGEDSKDTHVF